MTRLRPLQRRLRSDESGFTLIEMLVAGMVMLVVVSMMGMLFTTMTRSSKNIRAEHDMNEEARNAINRVAREVRQATQLTYVVNPDGPGYSANGLTAVSLKADFNGDGCTGNECSGTDTEYNPETITYCFNPGDSDPVRRTYLWLIPTGLTSTPASCDIAGALPILAGNVSAFKVEYRSNEYRFDSAPTDGVTTWRELDDATPPVGDLGGSDGDINTNALSNVDSMVVHITMAENGQTQTYDTQIDLRNRS